MKRALCSYAADPDIFFAEKGQSRKRIEAQKICMNCPVVTQCEDYRSRVDARFGIWAGKLRKRGEK